MTTNPPAARRTARRTADAAASADAPRPVPIRIDRATALGRIRACAAECMEADGRSVIHRLARAMRRGTGTARRAALVEEATAAVAAHAAGRGPDMWACAEAATWALARLARRSQAAGSAGRLLEDLVALSARGTAALADRDTRPARFVIVLARLFADVEACRGLERTGSAAVAEEIERLVTPEGAVVLSGSAAVVERVCRWTAVRDASQALGTGGWGDGVERRWAAACAGTLRLLDGRGRAVIGGGHIPVTTTAPLLAAVARSAAVGRRARRTARRLPDAARGRRGRDRGLLAPDQHDVAAATAVIRTGWDRTAVRVLLEYRDAVPHLEIAVGERLLVAGPWDWRVADGGRSLDAESAWSVSGWESGRKATFLEIAARLAGGMRLERQVVVLRRQKIVLLADAVVPADATASDVPELAWRSEISLAPGLDTEPAAETREVLVYDGAMRFMALPLAAPEWRVAGRGGIAPVEGRLVLEQWGHRRLYAPLWLDCDPRRIGRPLTWRQLTVADMRRNLPPHQAAGYRVQCGGEQWLLYRALDAPRNRTLLGCNVSSGFLMGRIRRSGAVARTVEIE